MFKVSPASPQIFIDRPNCVLEDRVQYSTVHIPSVMAILKSSIVWEFFEYTEFYIATQREKSGAQRFFDRPIFSFSIMSTNLLNTKYFNVH
jgi:hypothetical protein